MQNNMIVTLRSYNDIDHIVPIIWKVLREGHTVYLFGIGEHNFEDDYRIKFLLKERKLVFSHIKSSLFNSLKYNLFYWIFFIRKHNISLYLVEYSVMRYKGIRTHIFHAMRLLGKANVAVPHGYNVFTNLYINSYMKEILIRNPNIFKLRNNFTKYIFPQDLQEQLAIKMGIDSRITESLGSVRFSYLWHDQLSLIEKKLKRNDDKFTICFMAPHWSYNVDQELTMKLIDKIAKVNGVILYIKLHTREGKSIDIGQLSNIEIISDETSYSLIEKSDLVIAFGTSIIFEALLQNKPIIHPKYLHSNKTIFDDVACLHQAENEMEVVSTINNLMSSKIEIDSYCYKSLIFKYIYNNKKVEPLEVYYNLLKQEGLVND